MKRKYKINIDGVEREVEIDLGDDVLTRQQVEEQYTLKTGFEAALADRIKTALPNAIKERGLVALDELPKNADLKKKVFELLGIAPDGTSTLNPQQVEEIRKAIRESEVGPARTEAEAARKQLSAVLDRVLEEEILRDAGELNVKKPLRTKSGNMEAPIVAMLKGLFRWHPDHNRHFVAKGDKEFEFSRDPEKSGAPFRAAREYLELMLGKPEYKDFVEIPKDRGPDLGTPGGEGGKDVYLTPEQASDHQQYMAADKTATQRGGTVQIKTT